MESNAILTYEKVANITIIFKDSPKQRIENVKVNVYDNFLTIRYRTTNRKVRIIPFANTTSIILEVE